MSGIYTPTFGKIDKIAELVGKHFKISTNVPRFASRLMTTSTSLMTFATAPSAMLTQGKREVRVGCQYRKEVAVF